MYTGKLLDDDWEAIDDETKERMQRTVVLSNFSFYEDIAVRKLAVLKIARMMAHESNKDHKVIKELSLTLAQLANFRGVKKAKVWLPMKSRGAAFALIKWWNSLPAKDDKEVDNDETEDSVMAQESLTPERFYAGQPHARRIVKATLDAPRRINMKSGCISACQNLLKQTGAPRLATKADYEPNFACWAKSKDHTDYKICHAIIDTLEGEEFSAIVWNRIRMMQAFNMSDDEVDILIKAVDDKMKASKTEWLASREADKALWG